MTFYTQWVLPVVVAIALFGFFGWGIYMILNIFRITGVNKFFTLRRLKRKFKDNFEFDDDILNLCNRAVTNKWKYKHIKIIAKKSLKKDEILYTYFLVKKLKGGSKDEEGIGRPKGTVAENITEVLYKDGTTQTG